MIPMFPIDELMEIIQGPDFPTGGIICGRAGIRRGYYTGRSTIVGPRTDADRGAQRRRDRIIVSEIPYQQFRDRVIERIAAWSTRAASKGSRGFATRAILKEPVRLVIELKRDADPDVVLNQLYQFSPLQDSFSHHSLGAGRRQTAAD